MSIESRHSPFRSVLLFTFSMTLCACGFGQDAPKSMELAEMLRSPKVRVIRSAAAAIRVNPNAGLEHIELVARRANHPEFTKTFELLVGRASREQLDALLEAETTQQKQLIEQEIAKRNNPAQTPRQVPSPPAATSIAPKTPMGTGRVGTVPIPRTMGEAERAAVIQRLDLIGRKPRGNLLADDEWEFLFNVMEIDVGDYSSDSYKLMQRADGLLRRFRYEGKNQVATRFLDLTNERAHRYLYLATTSVDARPDICDRYLQFIFNEAGETKHREDALKQIPFEASRANFIARRLLEFARSTSNEELRDLCIVPFSKSQRHLSEATQSSIFFWCLENFEGWVKKRQTEIWGLPSIEIGSFLSFLHSMTEERRTVFVKPIVTAAEKSSCAQHFIVFVLGSVRCDLSPAKAFVAREFTNAKTDRERLALASAVLKINGRMKGLDELLEETLSDPDAESIDLKCAIRSAVFLDDRVSRFVPLLVKVMESKSHLSRNVLATLGKIGPRANSALSTLNAWLADPEKSKEHQTVLQTIFNLQTSPENAIPTLINVARDPDGIYRESVDARLFALQLIQSIRFKSKPSARLLAELTSLSNSPDRIIAQRAEQVLAALQRR